MEMAKYNIDNFLRGVKTLLVNKKLIPLSEVEKAIDDEPEYPDEMPDEMWEKIKYDRDAVTEALRLTVQLTKEGIKERLKI